VVPEVSQRLGGVKRAGPHGAAPRPDAERSLEIAGPGPSGGDRAA
jgi:hypothetical protein